MILNNDRKREITLKLIQTLDFENRKIMSNNLIRTFWKNNNNNNKINHKSVWHRVSGATTDFHKNRQFQSSWPVLHYYTTIIHSVKNCLQQKYFKLSIKLINNSIQQNETKLSPGKIIARIFHFTHQYFRLYQFV